VEIQQIRYFLAVAETSSFTRAADKLGVSQPAITSGIKRLEAELGAPLFHREGRRLLLSDLGEMMRPQLEAVLQQTLVAQDTAKNFRLLHQVPLRVGILATIGPTRFSDLLARFQRDNPGVELELIEASPGDLVRQLDDKHLDLAILSAPEPLGGSYRTVPLYVERYVVIFPKGHRLERLPTVTLADVSGEAYVDRLSCELREMVMEVCSQRNVELYARFRSMREDWIQAMVAAGIGVAFMPEHSVTLPELPRRLLVDPPLSRSVELVRVSGRTLTPAARAFSALLERDHARPQSPPVRDEQAPAAS
jgi:DNA-binding transcriptional LysR family regulator